MEINVRDLPAGTITLLFADIEGSTQLLRQLGDGYGELLTACRTLLRSAFQRWRGHEVETRGDAMFAVFARARDALSATVAAQRALASHAFPEGAAVCVRIGLHTGEPERTTEGYVGLDVHHASRIMDAGHGGQVLLSQTTRDLVMHDLPEGVSLRDLGELRLRDLQRASHLYQLVIARLQDSFPVEQAPTARDAMKGIRWKTLHLVSAAESRTTSSTVQAIPRPSSTSCRRNVI